MKHLYEELAEYAKGPDYPCHMPGHKRRSFGEMPEDLLCMDITEIDGFDDLHAPEGILRELQERIAALYGAQESFCLVNGSTCGILSAVSAAVPMGGKLLMARNCHKSVYHAAYLRKLRVSYLYPGRIRELDIPEAVTPEQVREALQREGDVDAVLIVSPTYEGRIARVREIAKIVHEFDKILIVDEAHGAHLGLAEAKNDGPKDLSEKSFEADQEDISAKEAGKYPENSCRAGADLVIHSLHKTLPAMTQTAVLHVNGPRVDRERLKRFLRIYQSSSPSYVLMASVDNALAMVESRGQELFADFRREFRAMMLRLQDCKKLRFVASRPDPEGDGFLDACRQDVGKLVICPPIPWMSGRELYDRLRLRYHLQPEMAAENFCLAMFTVGDTPEGYARMTQALLEIDRELEEAEGSRAPVPLVGESCGPAKNPEERESPEEKLPGAVKRYEFCEAWDLPWEEVSLEECAGRVCADFVNLYPPGVPLLVPGEEITEEFCRKLLKYRRRGLKLQGVGGEKLMVKCLARPRAVTGKKR